MTGCGASSTPGTTTTSRPSSATSRPTVRTTRPIGPDDEGTAFRGLDEVRRGVTAFLGTYEDIHYTDLVMGVDGDRGWASWTFSGSRRRRAHGLSRRGPLHLRRRSHRAQGRLSQGALATHRRLSHGRDVTGRLGFWQAIRPAIVAASLRRARSRRGSRRGRRPSSALTRPADRPGPVRRQGLQEGAPSDRGRYDPTPTRAVVMDAATLEGLGDPTPPRTMWALEYPSARAMRDSPRVGRMPVVGDLRDERTRTMTPSGQTGTGVSGVSSTSEAAIGLSAMRQAGIERGTSWRSQTPVR